MLNQYSFFDFFEIRSQIIDTKNEQSSKLQLACFTVRKYGRSQFTFYDMPEPQQDLEGEEKTDIWGNVKPLGINGGPSLLQSSNFYGAKILLFMKVQTESGTNYLLIQAGGHHLKSSIIVLNSKLQIREVPELDGLKIEQVNESIYKGHIFAVDADQNLIAIDIRLVCQGEKPYQIMSHA